MLGEMTLNVAKSYKYLVHIINDNLCDEADIRAKERSLYGRCNVLLRTFYFFSEHVKNKLFTYYCSTLYLCSLLAKYRKSFMQHFFLCHTIMHSGFCITCL